MELPRPEPNGGFIDLTDVANKYNLKFDLKEVAENLGKQRKIIFQQNNELIQAKITPDGVKHVEELKSQTRTEVIDVEVLKQYTTKLFDESDFVFENIQNKEGYNISYVPHGKFSEFSFRFNRYKFNSLSSNETFKIVAMSNEYKSLVNGFITEEVIKLAAVRAWLKLEVS